VFQNRVFPADLIEMSRTSQSGVKKKSAEVENAALLLASLTGVSRHVQKSWRSRKRWLNQSTHSSVANSTASKLRHGPRRWMTSAL
jgi:hypothetical protein